MDCTPTSSPDEAMIISGLSASAAKGIVGYSAGLIVKVVSMAARMVWPSGSARATSAAAMLPPAPALFSTITLVLSAAAMRSATARASVSVGPPAANATTIRIGLEVDSTGDWACAARPAERPMDSSANAAARRTRTVRDIGWVSMASE